jgi:hypothetical protein
MHQLSWQAKAAITAYALCWAAGLTGAWFLAFGLVQVNPIIGVALALTAAVAVTAVAVRLSRRVVQSERIA